MEGKQYYRALLEKYMAGNASEEEINDLFEELARNEETEEWESLVTAITMAADKDPHYHKEKWEPLVSKILREKEQPVIHSASFFRKWWWAAASIVFLLATGAYLLFINKPEKRQDIAAATVTDDIKPPITNRATVMLANGKTVYLDSAVNGTLAIQGNVQVVKLADGQIAYQGSATELAYNTLTNPRGSKVIDMALADGSHVWLNAGSSVTYPIAFIGNERKVSITGEAYFEIAHNAAKPFMVSKGEMQVQVLGTHFNVSAYDDEDAIRVTLLEGSVEVKSQKSKVRIVPGEQAVLASHSLLTINHSPDPEQVMAWKNGLFQFHSAGLPDVMKQLSRWYDVDIVYEGKTPVREFEGKIQRDLTLSQALKILEKNQVHFRVENRKLIVLP